MPRRLLQHPAKPRDRSILVTLEMGVVNLQSESVMAARYSTKEVFDLVTADDAFGVSDGESSED